MTSSAIVGAGESQMTGQGEGLYHLLRQLMLVSNTLGLPHQQTGTGQRTAAVGSQRQGGQDTAVTVFQPFLVDFLPCIPSYTLSESCWAPLGFGLVLRGYRWPSIEQGTDPSSSSSHFPTIRNGSTEAGYTPSHPLPHHHACLIL